MAQEPTVASSVPVADTVAVSRSGGRMARILVASLPFAGHVGPMAVVAGELTRRGHDVVAYCGAKYRQRFVATGAGWLPWTRATDFDDGDLAATFPQVRDGKGIRAGKANVEHVLFGTGAGQAADILAEAQREPFDLLVTDQLAFGAALAGEVLGTPWATVTVTPLSTTSRDLPAPGIPVSPTTGRMGRVRDAVLRGLARAMYRRMVDPMLNAMRAAVGLGPAPAGGGFDSLYSPYLVLAQGVPDLEYPRGDLPAHVRFVGRLATATAPDAAGSTLVAGARRRPRRGTADRPRHAGDTGRGPGRSAEADDRRARR
jgi:UDP:flavonoid glycosyltransferase YjiC (YdhE family)